MIQSFRGKLAAQVWKRIRTKLPPDIQRRALLRLAAIHSAEDLGALKVPPGNRLEALSGDRAGQHSIRINDQWRICFRWDGKDAHDVEIVDYH